MKKILVVDDDDNILEVVELILVTKGFDVQTNSNGFNLHHIVNNYQPDLILLDVRLPQGRLGTELCKELKQTYSIPIILFSAERQIKYKECNADNFLQKPFDVANLLGIVNSHLAPSN